MTLYSFRHLPRIPRVSGIYQILHCSTRQCYIGGASDVRRRAARHRRDLASGKHHAPRLQELYSKEGMNAFQILILEEVLEEHLVQREQFYLDSIGPGFNLCPMADSCKGLKHSKETCLKRAQASSKVWQSWTKEYREKRSKQLHDSYIAYKRSLSPEEKTEISKRLSHSRKRFIASLSPEERAAHLSKTSSGIKKYFASLTPEQKLARGRKLYYSKRPLTAEEKALAIARMKQTKANQSPERRAEILAKFRATMKRKRGENAG